LPAELAPSVGTALSDPNSPSASPFEPAVKYSLLGSAAASLPKAIDQSPSIVTARSFVPRSWPRKLPLEVKPLIRPSAEVADQNLGAERSEVQGSPGNSPGRIERAA
jgi:hypothetical protein